MVFRVCRRHCGNGRGGGGTKSNDKGLASIFKRKEIRVECGKIENYGVQKRWRKGKGKILVVGE